MAQRHQPLAARVSPPGTSRRLSSRMRSRARCTAMRAAFVRCMIWLDMVTEYHSEPVSGSGATLCKLESGTVLLWIDLGSHNLLLLRKYVH